MLGAADREENLCVQFCMGEVRINSEQGKLWYEAQLSPPPHLRNSARWFDKLLVKGTDNFFIFSQLLENIPAINIFFNFSHA